MRYGLLLVGLLLLTDLPVLAQQRQVTIRDQDTSTLDTLATERGKTVDETLQEEVDRTLDRLGLETLANQLETVRLHLLSLSPAARAAFVANLEGGAAFRAQEGPPAEAAPKPRVGPGAMPQSGRGAPR